jgi:hypothetical protein
MTTSTPTVLPPRTSWAADLHAAYDAGAAAVTALSVAPMVVTGREGSYYVEGGVCGFARVEVRPRTSAWAKWLKSNGWYSSDYHKCIYMNVSEYGQSMQRKEAFAQAVAAWLTARGYPGVDWNSTID